MKLIETSYSVGSAIILYLSLSSVVFGQLITVTFVSLFGHLMISYNIYILYGCLPRFASFVIVATACNLPIGMLHGFIYS